MSRAYVFLRQKCQIVPLGILDGNGCSFRYAKSWLARPEAFALAPDLPLEKGWFEFNSLPNAFRDQCPDRWGRKLMGILSERPYGELSEFEILTALHSPYHLGALAFGPTSAGPSSMAAWAYDERPLASVREIEDFARALKDLDDTEGFDEADDPGIRWQNMNVLRAMTASLSLGGGRPKATAVLDGVPYIVKFSRNGDLWNEPLAEYASMLFAQECGLNCAHCEMVGSTALLVRRFDISPAGPRHMISGFTLRCIREDGDWGGYQQLAEACRVHGIRGAGAELFRRMVFNALLRNGDDHPRNHAFFFDGERALAPAFNLLPFQGVRGEPCLALDCGQYGRKVSRKNILSRIEPFGLGMAQAEAVIADMEAKFSEWKEFFSRHGVCDDDLRKMSGRVIARLP